MKLLRVIQENEFERIGGSKTIKVDVRIIAATNRNLKLEVEQGTFREDLWYRLNVYPITMPPLRERKEDIPFLVDHFTSITARSPANDLVDLTTSDAESARTLVAGKCQGVGKRDRARGDPYSGSVLQVVDHFEQVVPTLPPTQTLEEVERDYIIHTLEKTGWRIEGHIGAAKILGLNPSTLRTRMQSLEYSGVVHDFN